MRLHNCSGGQEPRVKHHDLVADVDALHVRSDSRDGSRAAQQWNASLVCGSSLCMHRLVSLVVDMRFLHTLTSPPTNAGATCNPSGPSSSRQTGTHVDAPSRPPSSRRGYPETSREAASSLVTPDQWYLPTSTWWSW